MSTPGAVSTGTFNAGPDTFVAAEDLDSILSNRATTAWAGWRSAGIVPLGYKGDAAKTATTFPVIDGVRYSVPGDRARHLADGGIELLGRDSVTINSGGEKIFAEEVETAIASHPAVADVVVAGRPSERWGQEVVAVVALADGAAADAAGADRPRRRCHRPLQAAEGRRVPARHRAQPGGQGRLPVGARAGTQRRRLSAYHRRRILRYSYTVIFTVPIAVRTKMLEIRRGYAGAGRHGRRSGRPSSQPLSDLRAQAQ